jgi:hypothetical protein
LGIPAREQKWDTDCAAVAGSSTEGFFACPYVTLLSRNRMPIIASLDSVIERMILGWLDD